MESLWCSFEDKGKEGGGLGRVGVSLKAKLEKVEALLVQYVSMGGSCLTAGSSSVVYSGAAFI